MESHTSLLTLLLLALIAPAAATTRQSLVIRVVSDVMDAPPDGQVAETTFLMDLLARQYTPKCLRIMVLSRRDGGNNSTTSRNKLDYDNNEDEDLLLPQETLKYAETYIDSGNSKPYANVIINPRDAKEAKHTLRFMNENTERVTLFSCFTYLFTRPPDPLLLPELIDTQSKRLLTRYFLVNTDNITSATTFLLDERLRKEENVAALTPLRTGNSTLWQVLIRQLLHPSGSPQVLTANDWSRSKTLDTTADIYPEQMRDFYGTRLQGVTLDFKPFTDYQSFEGSRVVKPKPSLDVFILDVIARDLNFTYDLVMPEDGLWGYLRPDVSTVFSLDD